MRIHKLKSLLYGLVLLPMSMALADGNLQQELKQAASSSTPAVVHAQIGGEKEKQGSKAGKERTKGEAKREGESTEIT